MSADSSRPRPPTVPFRCPAAVVINTLSRRTDRSAFSCPEVAGTVPDSMCRRGTVRFHCRFPTGMAPALRFKLRSDRLSIALESDALEPQERLLHPASFDLAVAIQSFGYLHRMVPCRFGPAGSNRSRNLRRSPEIAVVSSFAPQPAPTLTPHSRLKS